MTEKYKAELEALAATLVTPERFGKVALAAAGAVVGENVVLAQE